MALHVNLIIQPKRQQERGGGEGVGQLVGVRESVLPLLASNFSPVLPTSLSSYVIHLYSMHQADRHDRVRLISAPTPPQNTPTAFRSPVHCLTSSSHPRQLVCRHRHCRFLRRAQPRTCSRVAMTCSAWLQGCVPGGLRVLGKRYSPASSRWLTPRRDRSRALALSHPSTRYGCRDTTPWK